MGESGVGVVEALVGCPELLALLERYVPAVTLPPGARDDARWPHDVVLRPRRVRRLDDASALFFVFFSQGTSSWRGLWKILWWCVRERRAHAYL
jgi:hypothetical protein